MAGGERRIRIGVVAAYPAVRAGLRALLEEAPDIEVIGEAGLDEAAEELFPDADLLVVELAGQHDLAAPPDFGKPLVVLAEEPVPFAPPEARPHGVVMRDVSAAGLHAAVHAVYEGLFVVDPNLVRRSAAASPAGAGGTDLLTPREREVLLLLAEGLPNKAIAARLGVSEHTVKFHVGAILGKLGVESRTEAVMQGARLGLVPL